MTERKIALSIEEALHVSIEWLKGETDEYETDITDKKDCIIHRGSSRLYRNWQKYFEKAGWMEEATGIKSRKKSPY